MFATPISRGPGSTNHSVGGSPNNPSPRVGFTRLLAGVVLICASAWLSAMENGPGQDPSAPESARTKKIYLEARARFQAATNDSEVGWKFARACFDCAVAAT